MHHEQDKSDFFLKFPIFPFLITNFRFKLKTVSSVIMMIYLKTILITTVYIFNVFDFYEEIFKISMWHNAHPRT